MTDRDMRALERSASPSRRQLLNFMGAFAVAMMLVDCVVHLYFVSRFADMAGSDISRVFALWTDGLKVDAQYSGAAVNAYDALGSAALCAGCAIVFAAQLIAAAALGNRNARLLAHIHVLERRAGA